MAVAKRDIIRAAKKAGFAVSSAECYWTPTPGEMVRHWEVTFVHASGQWDEETEFFINSARAVEYFRDRAATPTNDASGEGERK